MDSQDGNNPACSDNLDSLNKNSESEGDASVSDTTVAPCSREPGNEPGDARLPDDC